MTILSFESIGARNRVIGELPVKIVPRLEAQPNELLFFSMGSLSHPSDGKIRIESNGRQAARTQKRAC